MLGIAVGVAGVLWALFPGRTLDARIANQKPDAVSLAYVRSLVRARPSESAPRLRLAEIERLLGRFAAAEISLAPLLDAEGAAGRQARWQHLALGLDVMNAAPAHDPDRKNRAREAVARLDRLTARDAHQLGSPELERLARIELEFERPCRAAALYDRLARSQTTDGERWRREADRWYLAGGGCARGEPPSVTPMRRRSGFRPARRRPACGVSSAAAAPAEDPAEDTRAADRLLADGRVLEALPLVERAARARPDDAALWRKLATVATWSSRPQLALEAWSRLAQQKDGDALARALELARALHDGEAVIALLALRAAGGKTRLEDLLERALHIEEIGRPPEAVALLREHEQRFAHERGYWVALGGLLERQGDLAGALATSEKLTGRFGRTVEDLNRQSQLLWRLQRPVAAFERAQSAAPMVTPTAAEFWRSYADLAWTVGRSVDAALAHRVLWKTGTRRTPVVAERLLVLASDAGRLDEIVEIGRDAYARFHQPHHLLWAIEAAITAGRMQVVDTLLDLAGRDEKAFASQPRYWILKGQADRRRRRVRDARAALERAVAIQPSLDVQVELLWLAIEHRDRELLAGRVRALTPADQEDPQLWEVLAVAHDRLGDQRMAAAFARRHRAAVLDSLAPESRAAPADRRAGPGGQLLPATLRLQMALEEDDDRAVRAVLEAGGDQLSMPERIHAEVALGRDASAWWLLAQHQRRGTRGNPDELADLAEARWDLLERRPAFFEATANVVELGALSTLEQKVSGTAPLLVPGLALGVDVQARELLAHPAWIGEAWMENQYYTGLHVGFIADRWQGRLAAGVNLQDDRMAPSARLDQELRINGRLALTLDAGWNELPTESDALRAMALRGGLQIGGLWKMTGRDRLTLGAGAHRFVSRGGAILAAGGHATAAFEHDFALPWLQVSGRLEVEAQRNRLVRWLPSDVSAALGSEIAPDDLILREFQTPGLGLTLSRSVVASGRAVALRGSLDTWAGWVSPAGHITYGGQASVWLWLGSHSLSLQWFYFADRGAGLASGNQRYSGAVAAYSLGRF